MTFTPRPAQQTVLDYTRGKLAIAAVPGSGKTRTLSALAAKLVAEHLQDGEEVLVVTLVNAAVENFNAQIRALLSARGLLPNVGCRVRTLHSMCSDIVRENPGLLALADGFVILDERESRDILRDAVSLHITDDLIGALLKPDLPPPRREALAKSDLPDLLAEVAGAFIQRAKDLTLTPDAVRARLDAYAEGMGEMPRLAAWCADVYVTYQRGLTYRGAVDFQDLIRLALSALETDRALLARLRARWRYVLEDEAQDSSQLQERILRLLVGEDGNWVRVGDPNQAIYETFTTANPELLWAFLDEPGVRAVDLPESGRSAVSIQSVANALIDWTARLHPSPVIRQKRPLRPPYIQPVQPGDAQPNPPESEARIAFIGRSMTPDEEVERTIASIARWLPEHPDRTCAVLVPTNRRGYSLIDTIRRHQLPIPIIEVLSSTTSTRQTAGALGLVLRALAEPAHPTHLAKAWEVWRRDLRDDEAEHDRTQSAAAALRQIRQVEAFIAPAPGAHDWLTTDDAAALITADPLLGEALFAFREAIRRWHAAAVLPIDQLLLVLAADLFRDPADLALAHSFAVVLRGYANREPKLRLPQYIDILTEIARHERRYLGMDADARAFNPDAHPGKVAITTMHSAKGLEWDRVYLLSVNSYDFPSGVAGETFYDEKYFIRDSLNLRAEALAQLRAIDQPERYAYEEGQATNDARHDLIGERLRLLYVGITRARRELIVSFNTGRRHDVTPAAPFIALRQFVQTELGMTAEEEA